MEIYLNRNGQEVGPYPESEIIDLIQKGVVLPTDLVWKEGMTQWEPASKIFAASLATGPHDNVPPPVIGSPHRSVVPIPNSGQSKSTKLVIAGVLSLLLISAIGVVVFAVRSAMSAGEIEPDPYAHVEGERMEQSVPPEENPIFPRPARPLPEPPEPNPTIPLPDRDELVAAPLLSPRADLPVPLTVRLYNRRLTVQPKDASHSLRWIEFLGTNQVRFSTQNQPGTYTLTNQTAHLTFTHDGNATEEYIVKLSEGSHTNLLSELQLESGNEAPLIRLEVQAILPAHWGTLPPPTREELGITLPFDPVQLRTRALSGEAEAQGKLALCLRIGWGMRRNLVEAFHWAALAAQQNDLTGRFEHAYHWGIASHPPFNLTQAKQMHIEMVPELTAAAEAGSDEAYLQLSFIHSMKLIPEASQESALELLNKSARSYPRAWATISHLLNSPPKDYEKGTPAQIISWNRMAADRGLAKPMNILAVQLLRNPRPTETNQQEAYRLFNHAAEKGYPMAQLNLGKVLHNGILLEENPNEGDQWIKRAARSNQLAANEWADRLLNQKASGESDRSNTGLPMPGSPAERTQINPDQIQEAYTYFRRASMGRNKSVAKQARMQRIRLSQELPLDTLLQIETRERQQLPGLDYAGEIAQSIEGEPTPIRLNSSFLPLNNLWPSTAILVSMKTARQREIDNLATLQTNAVANHLLSTLYALDQIAPERLNRNLSQDRNFLLQTRLPGKINTRDKVARLNTDTRTLIALAFLNDKEGYQTVRNDLTQAQPETPSYQIKLTYARSLLLIDPDPKYLLLAEQLVSARTPGTSKSAHPEIAFMEAFIHYRRGAYQKAHQILEEDRVNNPDTAYDPNVPPPPTKSNRKEDSPFPGMPTFFSNTILCATIPHILMEGILHARADRPSAAKGAHLLAKAHLDYLWNYENPHVGAYLDDWIFCQLLERELTGLLAAREIDNE